MHPIAYKNQELVWVMVVQLHLARNPDNYGPVNTVGFLQPRMAVIEVSSDVIRFIDVSEGVAVVDWALSYKRNAVTKGCVLLSHSMPMNRCRGAIHMI